MAKYLEVSTWIVQKLPKVHSVDTSVNRNSFFNSNWNKNRRFFHLKMKIPFPILPFWLFIFFQYTNPIKTDIPKFQYPKFHQFSFFYISISSNAMLSSALYVWVCVYLIKRKKNWFFLGKYNVQCARKRQRQLFICNG